MKKNLYRITTIVTFTIISVLAFSITTNYLIKKEKELLDKKYSSFSKNISDKINSLIAKKKNATLSLTITLANNTDVLNILDNKVQDNQRLHKLSLLLRKETDFKNVWFQVIDKDGYSKYRSWSQKKDDRIVDVRSDLKQMLKSPQVKSTISVGRYDITFKAMVPIYKDGMFYGVIESITHFNSISRGLRISDNIEPIIIVEKKFSEQLRKNAFTKIFLQDRYIANLSVDKAVLKYLESKDINKYLNIQDYKIDENNLIINTPIVFNNQKLANFMVFKDLSSIDTTYIQEYKQNTFLYLGLFIALLGLILYIISYYLYSKEIKKLYNELNENQTKLKNLNDSLKQTVNEEVNKNYEKNKIMFQQSKMAAMGEMIGNIAHQWRQPLSVITTAASGMKLKKELNMLSDVEHDESLDMIVNSANYLSSTIDDFRNFFSPNKDKNRFNSDEFIQKVFNLVSSDYKSKDIQVITNIDKFKVQSFENELLQVMINILNNARDELVKVQDFDSRYIFLDFFEDKDKAVIKIKDSAGGIDKNIIDRIFEPYFTTKHQSQGTGIGLFMSEEIISKHMSGKIKVTNEVYKYKDKQYKGAQFELRIPIK